MLADISVERKKHFDRARGAQQDQFRKGCIKRVSPTAVLLPKVIVPGHTYTRRENHPIMAREEIPQA